MFMNSLHADKHGFLNTDLGHQGQNFQSGIASVPLPKPSVNVNFYRDLIF